MSKQPIGIFDSGVGGTSIWKAINQLLPHEHTIYLADSKHAPYGNKAKKKIIELSVKNTELLLDKGCKLIVVACNTATTNAIQYLRDSYKVPFIGIEPAIKPAALNTESKTIGILATKGTLSSELFHRTTDIYSEGIEVLEQEGEGIVSLIERGLLNSDEMTALIENYVGPMINAGIDHLVLGCTHYSYLIPQLKTYLPDHVKIIDSGEAVARQSKVVLSAHGLLNSNTYAPKLEFFTNGNPNVLQELIGKGLNVSYLDF